MGTTTFFSKNKRIQCIHNVLWAHMDCIGTNMRSGDGGDGWLINISWLLKYSAWIPVTSTSMNTDSHTGRAVHSGNSWMEMWEGGKNPPSLTWHKMQALPCCTCGIKGSVRPFIIALLFLSLAGLLDWAEAPGAGLTSSAASGPQRLQHICVFNHQCEIVQYDGCLMLKQDWYCDLGRDFSYQCFKIFIPSYLQSIKMLYETNV